MSVELAAPSVRVVFADQLVPGSIVLEPCHGRACRQGTSHRTGLWHELTILSLRTKLGITAVTVDEDGNQQPWSAANSWPVRVRSQ